MAYKQQSRKLQLQKSTPELASHAPMIIHNRIEDYVTALDRILPGFSMELKNVTLSFDYFLREWLRENAVEANDLSKSGTERLSSVILSMSCCLNLVDS